jgi:hypothetical protein
MNILKGIVTELRERRLWPVAVALLIGLVAVPVLLSKSPSSSASTQVPPAGGSGPSGHSVSVKLAGNPSDALHGKTRDPFAQQHGATATTPAGGVPAGAGSSVSPASTGTSASVSAGSSPSTGSSLGGSNVGGSSSGGGSSSSVTSGGGSSSSAPASSTAPATPKRATKPVPTGLSATEAYRVALSITNPAGGVQPIDPLVRLTPLPSLQQPLLVELGVLKGTSHVLFAVQPGAVVSGPGACIPGPVDCEILSLAPGQTESLAQSGSPQAATLFQITDLSVDRYATAAQASRARANVSRAGSQLLAGSTSSTLALFQYDPALGAVVDLRNLTVGGN